MKELQKENESKIFDAIQKLKDSIFGLNNSYVAYCYSDIDGIFTLSEQKVSKFIAELLTCAKQSSYYSETFDELIALFFELTIKFISRTCNFEEQQFVSLRKIAQTTEKHSLENMSVFEALIDNSKEQFDNVYLERCQVFADQMIEVNFDNFYHTIKHSIEKFIDIKKLNSLCSEENTKNIVMRLNRTSNFISSDIKRIAEIKGVFDYE